MWRLLAAKVIGLGFVKPFIWQVGTGQHAYVTFAPQKFPVIKIITNFHISSPKMNIFF